MVVGKTDTGGAVHWVVVKDDAASSSEYEVGLNLREKNKKYISGDIVFDDALPTYMRLRCTTPGTTSGSDLVIS